METTEEELEKINKVRTKYFFEKKVKVYIALKNKEETTGIWYGGFIEDVGNKVFRIYDSKRGNQTIYYNQIHKIEKFKEKEPTTPEEIKQIKIGNSYNMSIKIGENILKYTCTIKSIDEDFVSFIDRYGREYNYNKTLIIFLKEISPDIVEKITQLKQNQKQIESGRESKN